jgi:hypothetical protein
LDQIRIRYCGSSGPGVAWELHHQRHGGALSSDREISHAPGSLGLLHRSKRIDQYTWAGIVVGLQQVRILHIASIKGAWRLYGRRVGEEHCDEICEGDSLIVILSS